MLRLRSLHLHLRRQAVFSTRGLAVLGEGCRGVLRETSGRLFILRILDGLPKAAPELGYPRQAQSAKFRIRTAIARTATFRLPEHLYRVLR